MPRWYPEEAMGLFDADDDDDDKLMMTTSTRRDLEDMGVYSEIKARGYNLEVVPDMDAREAIVICLPADGPQYFPDDVIAKCDRCKVAVRHRPHVPLGAIPVCVVCFNTERIQKGKGGLEDLLKEWRGKA
jgi:hypothetical protein